MDHTTLESMIKTFQIGGETFIKIKTSENSGSDLRYGEVTKYIKELHIRNVDFTAVKHAFKKCRGQSVCIGGSAGEVVVQEQPLYTFEVSDDAMFCYLTLLPAGESGELPEATDIVGALKRRNIVFGLREESIKETLGKRVFRKKIVAAQGTYPEPGRDAKVKLVEGLCGDIRNFRSECVSVEKFRKASFIHTVKESDHIAWKLKETPGTEGRTIYGEEVRTLPGLPVESSGANIFMSDERVFANIDGHIIKTASGVRVETLLALKSVTNKKIVHDGSIKIMGDVESCPLIEASGDIEIHGTVNNTKIEAGRNIVIHGNLFTRQDKPIHAKNTFIGQNVSNAAITAENIIITATSFNSILTAFRTIQNTGEEGKIVGGRTCAGSAFFASALGSSTNIPTEISIATRDFFSGHKKDILGYYRKKIAELNSHMAFLEKKSELLETLKRGVTKDHRSVYNGLSEELAALLEKDEFKINKLRERLTRLSSQDAGTVHCEVLADKIFPNTSIALGQKKVVIKEPRSNIRIQIKEGSIITRTFYRNSARW